ncbi:hypothetical protein ACP4OV_010559 [Aristida adscensionis]
MATKAAAVRCEQQSPALPPALSLLRARSLGAWVVDLDDLEPAPDTPPFGRPVAVPFLWEELPGKPKRGGGAAASAPAAAAATTVVLAGGGATPAAGGKPTARPRPVPLRLPPRLQATSTGEHPVSLSTVLQAHGPYGCGAGGKRRPATPTPLRRTGSATSFRRAPSAGGGLFSRRIPWAVAPGIKKGAHDHVALSCSTAASSPASSSSSLPVSCFGDDYGHCHGGRPAGDGSEDSSDEKGANAIAKRLVRMPGLRRHKTVPNMTTSHIWASVRRGAKRITPWI